MNILGTDRKCGLCSCSRAGESQLTHTVFVGCGKTAGSSAPPSSLHRLSQYQKGPQVLGPAAVIGPRVEAALGRGQRHPRDMPDCCPQVVVVEQNGSFQVKIPKNFICEHCFGAFRSSYHLKRHVLIHTGESAVFNTSLFTGESLPYSDSSSDGRRI